MCAFTVSRFGRLGFATRTEGSTSVRSALFEAGLRPEQPCGARARMRKQGYGGGPQNRHRNYFFHVKRFIIPVIPLGFH